MSKKPRWPQRRAEIRKHLRRSTLLSDGAFRVWDELAAGWSWADPVCFPNYAMMAKAMGKHRNTIRKYVDELVEHGLVIRTRKTRGYQFQMIEDIPDQFIDPFIENKGLREDRRKSKRSRPPEPDVMHKMLDITEPDRVSRCTRSRKSDAQDVGHHIESDAQDVVHHDEQDVVHVDEDEKGKVQKQKKEKGKGKGESPIRVSETEGGMTASPSRCALGNEATEPDGEIVSYDENHEIEGLIEDPLDQQPRKFKPKQRAPDPALVSGLRKGGTPFPEAQGAAQSNVLGKSDPGVASPFIETPEGVLALLRGEVEEKWGKRASRGFPFELAKKGKISNQIRSAILRQYTPDVIRDMIRLLVWDWEVARGVCFPYRHDVPFPDLLSLVQYHKELANRVETGFAYPSSKRGSANTYKDLFIDRLERVADDDPF
jgi:hypothetical protein